MTCGPGVARRLARLLVMSAAALAVALGALGGASVHAHDEERYPDAPSALTVDAPDGTRVLLEHEHGIRYELTVTGGTVEPPLLHDGLWAVEYSGAGRTIRVGIAPPTSTSESAANSIAALVVLVNVAVLLLLAAAVQHRGRRRLRRAAVVLLVAAGVLALAALALDRGADRQHGLAAALADCWTAETITIAETSAPILLGASADGTRCTQSVVGEIAAAEGYDQAVALLDGARERLGEYEYLWTWYCGIAGDAAAAGAVLGGEDPRRLMREKSSLCDYSTLHGAGALALLLEGRPTLTPAELTQAVTGAASTGKVTSAGRGSPNLLLNTSTTTGTPDTPPQLSAPAAPTNLAATAGRRAANLTWTQGDDGGSALTAQTITVYESGRSTGTVTVTGTATAAKVGGLKAGRSYTFTVTATNEIGTSPASNLSNAVVPTR